MRTLYLDLETFSETPIAHGTHRYAEDSEILLLAYAWGEGEVVVVEHPTAKVIQALVDGADWIVIHDSAFDRTVLRHNDVDVPVEKIHDTLVQALAHSLPGALGQLCDILQVPADKAKDKAGKRLIQLFCKPLAKNRKLRRATKDTHPTEWAEFIEYAALDIEAMRAVRAALPMWNMREEEQDLWVLDQRINDRGVAVDLDLAKAALRAARRVSKKLAEDVEQVTDGAVMSTTQRDKTLMFLRDIGVEVEDLRRGTVDALLKSDALPDIAREVLENRSQAAATSPAKYKTLLNGVSSDGRLRGTLQFCGASRTGRWGGRMFQPQNLPRPFIPLHAIETGIKAMKLDVEDIMFANVMELCASAVRGSLVAPPGKKLVVSDLSNIEGRMLAWLAGEDWKSEAFRQFDAGVGHDIYKLAYARSFGKDPKDVSKDQRQIGKVQELALGYQGALGAFSTMAARHGIELPEDTILTIVKAWRTAHPNVKNFWYDSERAATNAVGNPGEVFRAGRVAFRRDGSWLRMALPSGRYLCYPRPFVDEDGKLSYEGVHQYTRKWERLPTYGGKLVENATQACARDILAHGVKRAEATGYAVVLHVHDELICEVPDGPEFDVEGLSQLMAHGPKWSEGLPLAAAGFECYRYRKDD